VANNTALDGLVNEIDAEINSGTLTPLQLAQYKIQRNWLTATSGDNAAVNEAEFIFANFPGTPGLPLGDGTFGAWMPVAHVHPLSRGSVHIQSSNPLTLPQINPNYLQKSYDLEALRTIVKFGRALSQADSFGAAISGIITPPDSAFASDDQLDAYVLSLILWVMRPDGCPTATLNRISPLCSIPSGLRRWFPKPQAG
jgi:choline dehydrogenase-like flavoprotein